MSFALTTVARRRYTDPCTVEGCETVKHTRLYCNRHWKMWRKYGDPLKEPTPASANLPEVRSGEEAWHYKGPDIGYPAAHKRVYALRGPAVAHTCVGCADGANEWSYDGGDPDEISVMIENSLIFYSTDPAYYSPRCYICHRAYDSSKRLVVA